MSTALDQHRAKPSTSAPGNPVPAENEADISTLIARLTAEVNQIACEKTKSIQHITNQMKMLALNALIESSRAGAQGAGFAVVAQEVRSVGQQVETIARELETQLTKRTGNLMSEIERITERVPLSLEGLRSGFYHERSGTLVAFHATPGYETYKGLGWYGVILSAAA